MSAPRTSRRASRSALLCLGMLTGIIPGWWCFAVAAEVTSPANQQLLVMSDGRIVRGNITKHAVGYYIERPGGTILLPAEQVRCVARDLPDAYRQQREQMIEPTSAMLIQLAEWCISYRLYDEAGDELRRALRRDPENDTARQMLGRLDEMLRKKPAKSLESARIDSWGVEAADVEALGGLSREVASEFTAKVQPLLINKCGNAHCHGTAATNDFRLSHVRLGTSNHRLSSQRNLALVLKYVDIANPRQSPILTMARGSHGGMTFALFGGASGRVQEDLLTSWITRVARERQTEEQKLAQRTPLKPPSSPAMSPAPVPVDEPNAIQLASQEVAAPAAITNSDQPPRRLAESDPFNDPLPGADRPPRPVPRYDAFDPEVFNRQFAQPGGGRLR